MFIQIFKQFLSILAFLLSWLCTLNAEAKKEQDITSSDDGTFYNQFKILFHICTFIYGSSFCSFEFSILKSLFNCVYKYLYKTCIVGAMDGFVVDIACKYLKDGSQNVIRIDIVFLFTF